MMITKIHSSDTKGNYITKKPNKSLSFKGIMPVLDDVSDLYRAGEEYLLSKKVIGLATIGKIYRKISEIYGFENNSHIKRFFQEMELARFVDKAEKYDDNTGSDFFGMLKLGMGFSDSIQAVTSGNSMELIPIIKDRGKECDIFGSIALNTCELLYNKKMVYKSHSLRDTMLDRISVYEIKELVSFYTDQLYPSFFKRVWNNDTINSFEKNISPSEHLIKLEELGIC